MTEYLSSDNFPAPTETSKQLTNDLDTILRQDYSGSYFEMLGSFQRVLADNSRRKEWPIIHKKLETLFKCGTSIVLDGPTIGIPISIKDSDYFKNTVQHLGRERSRIASIEWMATAWNMTYGDTGLWMGKTFEPVTRETVADKCGNDPNVMENFNPESTRIGRNYFREPSEQATLSEISLPVLSRLWNLQDRPLSTAAEHFDSILTEENLAKEKHIPYSKTGGQYLANLGLSVVPEMQGKTVYQLNYRWPALRPVYPMTRLVDELVQIGDGIYLGQLIYATRNYSLGSLRLPFCPDLPEIPIGEPYDPRHKHPLDEIWRHFSSTGSYSGAEVDYGYQNNGYFLLMDPAYAQEVYADNAFPQLRPRPGECGYSELEFDHKVSSQTPDAPPSVVKYPQVTDWTCDWRHNDALRQKFTTFIAEPSPKVEDGDVRDMLQEDESILQMLQRVSEEISAQTRSDDRLIHFEKLHRLFRSGVAPVVEEGLFKGHGTTGFNVRVDSNERRHTYGRQEQTTGFDYYHGATLNLHLGFRETLCPDPASHFDESELFPSSLASVMEQSPAGSNTLNMIWHSLGKYIFPWAGKSYEKINGRTLSMMIDESADLAERYPERVGELQQFLASAPHYNLVQKNANNYWQEDGPFTKHLQNGSWDSGMSDEDKAFWEKEASQRWVFGNNIQDERIVAADPLMHIIDMNYRIPDPSLQAVSQEGPSPFARQGYIFLGTSDRESILEMNNGNKKKKVFQFHYRYPMIGGPVPIGFCLDELVEIADGLFLGQLIYATSLQIPFHSSVDPKEYNYQLFGYFLLMDDAWQYHRLAIGLDTWRK